MGSRSHMGKRKFFFLGGGDLLPVGYYGVFHCAVGRKMYLIYVGEVCKVSFCTIGPISMESAFFRLSEDVLDYKMKLGFLRNLLNS